MALALQPYVAFSIVFYGGTLLKSKTFNIESMTLKQWPAIQPVVGKLNTFII